MIAHFSIVLSLSLTSGWGFKRQIDPRQIDPRRILVKHEVGAESTNVAVSSKVKQEHPAEAAVLESMGQLADCLPSDDSSCSTVPTVTSITPAARQEIGATAYPVLLVKSDGSVDAGEKPAIYALIEGAKYREERLGGLEKNNEKMGETLSEIQTSVALLKQGAEHAEKRSEQRDVYFATVGGFIGTLAGLLIGLLVRRKSEDRARPLGHATFRPPPVRRVDRDDAKD